MAQFIFATTRPTGIVAFRYDGTFGSYDPYCQAANVQYYGGPNGPIFKIGPTQEQRDAVIGHYYYCPQYTGAGASYLIELTPAEWDAQFSEIDWAGAVHPSDVDHN